LIPDLLAAGLTQYRSIDELWPKWESLSPREQDVAALTCLGYTNRQIAARLSLSPETIKTHVRNVLFKFDVNSKAELRHILANWDFSGWM
jgi:DNA-binding CsgD family transcriptional regulator